ncbi:MAG: cobalamin-binding protein [Planctomycetes bacterium]|nr:cobalamin-binding protein [Planctomycetota bacterium]
MNNPRIVSLLPSATEIVCALGFADALVARSHECDFPAGVDKLPIASTSKFHPTGTSIQIHNNVTEILRNALSVYHIDEEVLRRVEPTHIITQTQCEVCAVSAKDVEDAVCRVLATRPQIVALEPNSLTDVLRDFQRVADALGTPERGRELIAQTTGRLWNIAERSKFLPRPRVATIEWIEPLMAAGNWVPTLIEMAGGINLHGKADEHSPWMKFEELVASRPEVIVVMPCGFDMQRAASELPVLTRQAGWRDLPAVREQQVYVTDGHQFFNRPGPRLAESLEILAEILHPQEFQFGHEGKGWQRL